MPFKMILVFGCKSAIFILFSESLYYIYLLVKNKNVYKIKLLKQYILIK